MWNYEWGSALILPVTTVYNSGSGRTIITRHRYRTSIGIVQIKVYDRSSLDGTRGITWTIFEPYPDTGRADLRDIYTADLREEYVTSSHHDAADYLAYKYGNLILPRR